MCRPIFLCGMVPTILLSSLYAAGPTRGLIQVGADFAATGLERHLRVCPLEVQEPAADDSRCTAGTAESIAAVTQMRPYDKPLWALLEIRNITDNEIDLVLEHALAITERVTVQDLSDKNVPLKVTGEAFSVKTRDFPGALPSFEVVLPARSNKILRISIASQIVTRPGFTLYPLKQYIEERQVANVAHATFFGLMASMVLFNLLLYFRLRLRMYLFYVLFIFSLSIMYLGLYGHGFAFIWVDAFWWQKYSHSIAKFTAAFFGIAFFSEVLNVRNRLPRLDRLVRWIYPAIALAAVVTPFLASQGVFLAATIIVAIAVIYSMLLGVLSLIGKLPFSMPYAVAMLSLLVGALINLLQTAALIPSNTFTLHAMQVGTALETIFLSIALGDRYTAIESENRGLQLQRLEDKKRIARDIHDVIGTEFQMRLIEIQSQGDNPLCQKLTDGLRGTLNKIREFLFLLHTEENLPVKLEAGIADLLGRLESAKGFEIQKKIHIVPDVLDSAEAYHLERTVNEIISNIARHAKAKKIRFELRVDNNGGFLWVSDDGVGFDKALVSEHIGMESLAYRAQRLRGRLRVSSAVGKGTRVALKFATT